MSRAIAPTNQWNEPKPAGVAAVLGRAFPVELDGQWGWSPIPSHADGIFQRVGHQVGIDDDRTTGGVVRVPNMGVGIAPRAAPTVEITSPVDGGTFSMGDVGSAWAAGAWAVGAWAAGAWDYPTAIFTATAIDADGDDISDTIEWEDMMEGPLGTGASITPAFAASGMHFIYAAVKDSLGLGNLDLIRVVVP